MNHFASNHWASNHWASNHFAGVGQPSGPGGSGGLQGRGRSHKREDILFESDSINIDEPAFGFLETSADFNKEIERFESAVQDLTNQIELVQSEIEVFKARESLEAQLRAEFLIEDTLQTRAFIDGLLLQLISLRMVRRRRREEEELIFILMMEL